MDEPRALLISGAFATPLRSDVGTSLAARLPATSLGMVNASRVSMLVPGNRRPSGRARSSPQVRRWLGVAATGGRDDRPGGGRLTTRDVEHGHSTSDVLDPVAGSDASDVESILLVRCDGDGGSGGTTSPGRLTVDNNDAAVRPALPSATSTARHALPSATTTTRLGAPLPSATKRDDDATACCNTP